MSTSVVAGHLGWVAPVIRALVQQQSNKRQANRTGLSAFPSGSQGNRQSSNAESIMRLGAACEKHNVVHSILLCSAPVITHNSYLQQGDSFSKRETQANLRQMWQKHSAADREVFSAGKTTTAMAKATEAVSTKVAGYALVTAAQWEQAR
eukprot:m.301510 g.301510  ORF g.301510 m.301510 type:complete len:150 (-) comp19567_c0_seq16:1614-2063(-)